MFRIVMLLLIAKLCVQVSSDDCILNAIGLLSGKDPNNVTSTHVETQKTNSSITNNGSSMYDLDNFEKLYTRLKEYYEKKVKNLQAENALLQHKFDSTSSNVNSIHTIQTFCTCNVTDHTFSKKDCDNSQANIFLEKVQEIHQKLANLTDNVPLAQSDCTANQNVIQIKRTRRTRGKYVGCYRDRVEHRGLKGFTTGPSPSTSVDSCIAICRAGNYVYAGLQAAYDKDFFVTTVLLVDVFFYS